MSDCVTHEIVQTLWQNYTEVNRRVGGPQAGEGGNGRANNYSNRYANRNNDDTNGD